MPNRHKGLHDFVEPLARVGGKGEAGYASLSRTGLSRVSGTARTRQSRLESSGPRRWRPHFLAVALDPKSPSIAAGDAHWHSSHDTAFKRSFLTLEKTWHRYNLTAALTRSSRAERLTFTSATTANGRFTKYSAPFLSKRHLCPFSPHPYRRTGTLLQR